MKKTGEATLPKYLKVTKLIFSIIWSFAPIQILIIIIFRIVRSLDSLFNAILIGVILDGIIELIKTSTHSLDSLMNEFIYLGVYTLVTQLIFALGRYAERYIMFYKRASINLLFIEKINSIGVQQSEDPQIANKFDNATLWAGEFDKYFYALIDLVSFIIAFLLTGLTIFQISYIIPSLVLILGIINAFPRKYFRKLNFNYQVGHVEERRKSWRDHEFLINPAKVKEVSILGAYDYLHDRFKNFWTKYNHTLLKMYAKSNAIDTTLYLITSLIIYYGYYIVIEKAVLGLITIGSLTVFMQAIKMFSGSLNRVFMNHNTLSNYVVKLMELVDFFDINPAKDGDIKLPRLKVPPAITINNLSFKYPNTDKLNFENLNLSIKSGEKVAIVGQNGAGKTTLIKLLARIYSPEKGSININKNRLEDLKIDDWYKNIGILFQEYNFYEQFTVEENIFIGNSVKKLNKEKIIQSAKMSDADEFISKYDLGYNQVMSEKFKNGIRPSTGQKQKIAIARLFYRNAPLVIFDEPTAAIDAVSEYNIFNEIYKFFKDKTVIIISHRFSTVRNADKIIVMDEGKIIEYGSHSELMKLKGKYERAFTLQAEGYGK